MTYDICGVCLHSKSTHEKHNGHFMYCASCFKLCDLDEYNIVHTPSMTVIQDGVKYKCK